MAVIVGSSSASVGWVSANRDVVPSPRRPAHSRRGSPGAVFILVQNLPARVVMEILGHSQLAMTTDLYSHVMPTALREAADAMDRVFIQPN